MTSARHLISINDLSPQQCARLIQHASWIGENIESVNRSLTGRSVGIYFRQTSTRTRTSFNLAAAKLGADVIVYGPNDLQSNTGESTADTARVLSQFLDIIVIRMAEPLDELRVMAAAGDFSIINAMSSDEHPTQAISDFAMMLKKFGTLENLRILYMGEGNNTAAALALLASKTKEMSVTFLTPTGYELDSGLLASVVQYGEQRSTKIIQSHDPSDFNEPFDVVYTTRWQTTGTQKLIPNWRQSFQRFRVTSELMDQVSTPSTVFMHDLPAVRGDECTTSVIDGSQSIVFEQAQQKLATAMAILQWCVLGDDFDVGSRQFPG